MPLTKDSFVLLVMGFTGAKAMEFKIKYIEAFNEMESKLREQQISRNAHLAICENGKKRYLHPELGMLSPVMKEIKKCAAVAVRKELTNILPQYLSKKSLDTQTITSVFANAIDKMKTETRMECKSYQLSEFEVEIIEKIRGDYVLTMSKFCVDASRQLEKIIII